MPRSDAATDPITLGEPQTGRHLQNQFHVLLSSYLNGGCLSRRDRLWAAIHPVIPFRRNARRVSSAFREMRNKLPAPLEPRTEIRIPFYDSSEPRVKAIGSALNETARDGLAGAYVHGSLATNEAIPYSDLDAMLIVRDTVLSDSGRLAALGQRLSRLRRLMFAFDPLQHHGWMVVSEADLESYCETYLPVVVYHEARSLLPDLGLILRVARRDSSLEARQLLVDLAHGFLRSIEHPRCCSNTYLLKASLSQFMLLPAAYLHARDGVGVAKKESFVRARSDFSPSDWEPMDHVSTIRERWHFAISTWRRRALRSTGPWRRQLANRLAPIVPQAIRDQLTPDLIDSMRRLAAIMPSRFGLTV